MPKLDALVSRHSLDVLDRDAVAAQGVVRPYLRVHVALDVDQDAPAHKPAARVPVVEGGQVVVGGGLRRDQGLHRDPGAVVGQPRGLVLEMGEAVPLAADLRVEGELVIPAVAARGRQAAGRE